MLLLLFYILRGRCRLENKLKTQVILITVSSKNKTLVLLVNSVDPSGPSKQTSSLKNSELTFLCHVDKGALNRSISMSQTPSKPFHQLHYPSGHRTTTVVYFSNESTLWLSGLMREDWDRYDTWCRCFNLSCMAADCDGNIVVFYHGVCGQFSDYDISYNLCTIISVNSLVLHTYVWGSKMYKLAKNK